jgi:hypothetical protein
VVLSDHGQSQGAVFADRYGEDLAALVRRLSDTETVASATNAEGSGALNSMIAGSSSTDSVMGRALGRASDKLTEQTFESASRQAAAEQEDAEKFLVFGSGNLGLIYVAGESRRLTLDDLTGRFPALVPGLVAHPGIAFAVVDTVEHGPVVLGTEGEHRVREGVVVGEDPLAAFGPEAPGFVLRAAQMPEAPDIYVNSLLDELGEVAAFEGLVGCHGGLGGWQDRAMIVWPAELPAPDGMLVGADAVHRQLVAWLEHVGHRAGMSVRAPASS